MIKRHAFGLVLATVLAQPAAADVITDWNQTAIAVMNNARTVLNPQARNLAMMHVAMSDAVNAVQNKYSMYAAAGASAPGAAAAAKSILLQQLPGQKAAIEQAFEASLKALRMAQLGR